MSPISYSTKFLLPYQSIIQDLTETSPLDVVQARSAHVSHRFLFFFSCSLGGKLNGTPFGLASCSTLPWTGMCGRQEKTLVIAMTCACGRTHSTHLQIKGVVTCATRWHTTAPTNHGGTKWPNATQPPVVPSALVYRLSCGCSEDA
jgi:hypothetical protein